MQIEQRGAKWRARVRIDGQDISRTFNDQDTAERWASELEDAASAGRLHERIAADLTFAEALASYSAAVLPRLRGRRQQAQRVEQLGRSALAAMPLRSITRSAVRKYRDARLQSITPSTWNRDLALIRAVLSHAVAELDAAIDWRGVVDKLRLSENPARTRRIADEEVERIVEGATDPEARAWFRLARATAMRRGEIAGLQWSMVDIAGRCIRLPMTKNGSARSVPLASAAVAALQGLPRRLDGAVFTLTADQATAAFRRAAKRAGVQGATLHDLRAAALSAAAERGLSVPELRAMGGHKSMALLRYMRPPTDVAELARRLG